MGIKVTFYAESPNDGREEVRRREAAQGIIDDYCAMPWEVSDALFDLVLPVPDTGNVLGYFKLETDMEVSYKKFGDFRANDMEAMDTFWRNWAELQDQESSLIQQRLHGES